MLRLITAPWISQAIYAVAKLNIADQLAAGPRSADQLAEACAVDPDALARVLRALHSIGVFGRDSDGNYSLTELGETLRSGAANSVRGMAVMFGEPWHWRALGELLGSVRSGETAFERLFGLPFFQFLHDNGEAAVIFDDAMTAVSMPDMQALVAAYPWGTHRCLVDVAGGRGHVLRAVLEAHPQLNGMLFDVPYAVEHAIEHLRAAGVHDRIRFVTGDFFQSVPSGGDLYFLKQIIHDWDDERALLILRNVRRVVPDDGTLLLGELVVSTSPGPQLAPLLDLEMFLMAPRGRERTAEQYADLFRRAGFELTRVIPTVTELCLLEGAPR